MSRILNALKERVLLGDGATGSFIQAADLDVEKDFLGAENCSEILNESRPDFVRDMHRRYFQAGADLVLTNSFGGSSVTLDEFDLGSKAYDLNKSAAELAREAAEEFNGDGRERFVVGSIGPGTKLPTLGHIGYDDLEAGLAVQARGLIDGGVDAVIVETCQDTLQAKAAINGVRSSFGECGREVPIFCQVTVETNGTLLVGAEIAAAAIILEAMKIDALGLNCATGPAEMAAHVTWLSENWPALITVMPNAGLPELRDGQPYYPLQPDELASWLKWFVSEQGVNLIGGCCGTDDRHITAVDAMLRDLDAKRPAPKQRQFHWTPGIASLYSASAYVQENAYLSIGERCNANGSKKFREHQAAEEWDACVAMAREQGREGSHALDICTAYVGRDEIRDMTNVLTRVRGAVDAALVIDSTELPVLEVALKLYGGKAIINSINLEDGEEPARARLELARKFGAAVIALTIDETGMAKTASEKLAVARRLHDLAVNQYGLAEADLLFDPLTFTICTGNEDDRELGLETLKGIELLVSEFPNCQIILGLSNISFGLKPAARHVLNSVFLDEALKRGMTGAILHMSKIMPLHRIDENESTIALDLIYDRRSQDKDPLHEFIACFEDRKAEVKQIDPSLPVEQRLHARIVDGEKVGLDADLDEAIQSHEALDIINEILLGGMKEVGELFGSGQMQLPFVLQSAETMKMAVSHLEPHMDKVDGQHKGTVVLATVKGDVHDIGKNLVDIILTNNGYNVVNLGIKQPIETIVAAAREHQADAIGLSGLLVKSTTIMRENLIHLTNENIETPVFLGGAALTRGFVENDCLSVHGPGRVAYARDAFDGLHLMDLAVKGTFDDHIAERKAVADKRPARPVGPAARSRRGRSDEGRRPLDYEEIKLRREALEKDVKVPLPPFLGPRVLDNIDLDELVPFLNERMLYQFHWGYRKDGRSLEDYMAWAKTELRPVLRDLLASCKDENILLPKAVYGFWRAAADGDNVVLYGPDAGDEVARFSLPRQERAGGLCVADFFRDIGSGEQDIIALQAVTVGAQASDIAREWFAADRYKDYVFLHGLSVEMAEAAAEYVHRQVRTELHIVCDDEPDVVRMLSQGYRGARYSFGYPACPNLADQEKLLSLLQAERIGLVLGDEDQLHPEQSTSAIVAHHPQARYFNV